MRILWELSSIKLYIVWGMRTFERLLYYIVESANQITVSNLFSTKLRIRKL